MKIYIYSVNNDMLRLTLTTFQILFALSYSLKYIFFSLGRMLFSLSFILSSILCSGSYIMPVLGKQGVRYGSNLLMCLSLLSEGLKYLDFFFILICVSVCITLIPTCHFLNDDLISTYVWCSLQLWKERGYLESNSGQLFC